MRSDFLCCHAVYVCRCLMYMFEYDKRRNGNDNENCSEKVKFRGGAEVLIKRQIFIMLSVTFIALKFFFFAGIFCEKGFHCGGFVRFFMGEGLVSMLLCILGHDVGWHWEWTVKLCFKTLCQNLRISNFRYSFSNFHNFPHKGCQFLSSTRQKKM